MGRPAAHGIIQALRLTHLVGPVSRGHKRTSLAAESLPQLSANTATSSYDLATAAFCLLVTY
jgi:hypothetical protein